MIELTTRSICADSVMSSAGTETYDNRDLYQDVGEIHISYNLLPIKASNRSSTLLYFRLRGAGVRAGSSKNSAIHPPEDDESSGNAARSCLVYMQVAESSRSVVGSSL